MLYRVSYRHEMSGPVVGDDHDDKQAALDHAEELSKTKPGWVEVWRVNTMGEMTRLVAQFKGGGDVPMTGHADANAPTGQFSAHNVVLPDGTMTLPGEPLLADSLLCRVALAVMSADMRGGSVIDLGCLDGGYAAEFARHGFLATGVEARAENVAIARRLQRELGLPNLNFAQADVRDYLRNIATLGGSYDAVFCAGLLYHLDEPVKFLRLVGEVTRHVLILSTHYEDAATSISGPEGYSGSWYTEDGSRWASVGNRLSFWLTMHELERAITEAGFMAIRLVDQDATKRRGLWVAHKP